MTPQNDEKLWKLWDLLQERGFNSREIKVILEAIDMSDDYEEAGDE